LTASGFAEADDVDEEDATNARDEGAEDMTEPLRVEETVIPKKKRATQPHKKLKVVVALLVMVIITTVMSM
jgi:hypothetical protein